MKFSTLALLFALPLFGLACEEQAPAPDEGAGQPVAGQPAAGQPGTPAEGQPAVVAPSAVEICKGIVDAAKAKDEAKIVSVATDGAAEALAGEGVKDHMFALLTDAACGEETKSPDGAKAMVAMTKGEAKMDMPFTKAGDAVKFDVAAFIEKNPIKKEEGKKGKKEKVKKEKAKKGKKGKK
jgi:hypothetical protein